MPVSPTRQYRFPFADEWQKSKCDPTALAVPSQGADISAARSRTCSPATTASTTSRTSSASPRATTTSSSPTSAPPAGPRRRPGDRQRPGRRAHRRRPTLRGPRQRQPDHAPGRRPGHHQPVPVPADRGRVLRALRGRRPRHLGVRPRVHPRDLQPHGRRARRGLTGFQGGAMGESWSDLVALEYLHEYGYVPLDGANAWAVGAVRDRQQEDRHPQLRARRNPLNYTDVGYDLTGPGGPRRRRDLERRQLRHPPGAGGEVRRPFPSTDRSLQLRCADGRPGTTRPRRRCRPTSARATGAGSRSCSTRSCSSRASRHADARDAYLAADRMRFGGANQTELWAAFATRGMGESASTNTTEDDQPKAGFDSPLADERDASRSPTGTAPASRSTSAASRRASRRWPTPSGRRALGSTVKLVPGTYDFLVRSAGLRPAALHADRRARARRGRTTSRSRPTTRPRAQGATVAGAGTDLQDLIDDTESHDVGRHDRHRCHASGRP